MGGEGAGQTDEKEGTGQRETLAQQLSKEVAAETEETGRRNRSKKKPVEETGRRNRSKLVEETGRTETLFLNKDSLPGFSHTPSSWSYCIDLYGLKEKDDWPQNQKTCI